MFESCINSLLNDDAESAEALFGGLEQLEFGLIAIQYQLGNARQKTPMIEESSLMPHDTLLALEKKLPRNPQVFKELMDGITEAQQQLDFSRQPIQI